jgi:hypothetical protein
MAYRSVLGCLRVVTVTAVCVFTWTGCKDKGAKLTAADLDRQCEQLAVTCGDKDKHTDKILDGCKLAATAQVERGCITKAISAYDCYQRSLCGGKDRVWALDDFGVLAERHGKCVDEHKALRECAGTSAGGAAQSPGQSGSGK